MREAVRKEIHTLAQVVDVDGYDHEVQCTLEIRFDQEDYRVRFMMLQVHGSSQLIMQAMWDVYKRACELGQLRLAEVLGGKQLALFGESRTDSQEGLN
jgi:hypothetical protein